MKLNKVLFLAIIIVLLSFIPNISRAVKSDIEVEKISVISKSGIYKTGDVLKIEVTFSGNVYKIEKYLPTLKLKFGSSTSYRSVLEGSINDNKIVYEYTIDDRDGGKLTLNEYSVSSIKDDNGNEINTSYKGQLTGNEVIANPIEWTDTKNVSITVNNNSILITNGLKEIPNHLYYAFITNSKQEPKIGLDKNDYILNPTYVGREKYIADILEKSGDIYYHICEGQMNYDTGKREHKFILSKKIERPKQHNLNSRISCHFFSDRTSIYLEEPHDSNNKRKVNLKIGKVTDNSILLAIKNEEGNSLSKLLSYAKNSKENIYTGKLEVTGEEGSIINNMNLVNDEYYYVYALMDSENGKYYEVEDVSLYQARIDLTNGRKYFHNYLDDDFSWKISQEDKSINNNTSINNTDLTIANKKIPQTGENIIIFILVGFIVILVIVTIMKIRKYRF